jgi:hypothetical protein
VNNIIIAKFNAVLSQKHFPFTEEPEFDQKHSLLHIGSVFGFKLDRKTEKIIMEMIFKNTVSHYNDSEAC